MNVLERASQNENGRNSKWRTAAAVAIYVFLLVYYWTLLSDGKFIWTEPLHYGLTFNSMIEHLARGEFDVDRSAILKEGFTREGHTYAYFGILPALLRWPLLLFPKFQTTDFTIFSCAVSAAIAAMAKLFTILHAGRLMGDTPYRGRIVFFAMVMIVFGGAQVQFLRPSLFQEALFWASAIASLFVFFAFRWCTDQGKNEAFQMTAMAVLAGLCLLTRVSTSLGLYAACGGMMLAVIFRTTIREGGRKLLRVVLVPLMILVIFASLCGYINYQRWGNPLTFQDYRYYDMLTPDDPIYAILKNHGYFSLLRLPFGLSYYFLPVWTWIDSSGHFMFRDFQTAFYFTVEFPPSSFLISDLFLLFLFALGIAWLRRNTDSRIDKTTALTIASGLAIPGLFMLTAVALCFRYRMEFYLLFDFVALFGLLKLAEMMTARPRALSAACTAMLLVSVVGAHGLLVTYKIAPWGDSADIEGLGWSAAYQGYFRMSYPDVYRRLFQP